MKHRTGAVGLLAVVLLLSGTALYAQVEQGRLVGTVKDAQGGVLPGVTVTATSPALIGQRTAATEVDGRLLFTTLPSGTYTVRFDLQGFQPFQRENIVVTQGTTLTIDATLQVASLAETVTVTGESPVVDTTTTKVGATFSGQALVGVPSSTDLWGNLAQTPGVRMQGYDVGGSHKSQQTGYDAFGIRGQAKVVFEGIDNTEGDNGAFFYSDFYAVNEVSVTAVGGDVETSAPGATSIQTFKSGGNRFSGLEHFTYEPTTSPWMADNVDSATRQRGFTGNPNLSFWEGHLDVGGPILRDKLWFFGAYNQFHLEQKISGIDPSAATDITDVTDPMLKLTYRMGRKDTFVGFLMPRNNKNKPNRGLSASTSPDSVLAQDSKTWIKKIEWQRIWSNRMFMDVRVAACCEVWPMRTKVDAAVKPPRTDSSGLVTGAGWNAFTLDYGKPQTLGTLTYFLPTDKGSHDLKFGYEYIFNHYRQGINGQSGPIQYLDRNNAADQIQLIDVGAFDEFGNTWQPGYDDNTMFSVYAQDRWSPASRLTITGGARFGYQRPHYETGTRAPVLSEIFTAKTIQGQTILTRHNVAPRVGFVYDLFGNGKTAAKLFYGRYYAIYGNNFTGLNPGGVNSQTYTFNDLNGNRLYNGRQELGTLQASSGGSSTTIDPNLKQPYGDEISTSIEHQFWGESSVRAVFVHKVSRNIFGLVNTARLGAVNVPVTVPNPFDSTQVIHALDVPTSLRGVVTNQFTNIPDSDASYNTVSLSAQHRFRGGLFIQGGVDRQWRDEIRSPNSPSTSPLNTDPINVYSFGSIYPLSYSADVANRQKNTNWQARMLGRYEVPQVAGAVGTIVSRIGIAGNIRVQSGYPYSPVASIRLPVAGTQSVFIDNIDNHHADNAAIADFRLDKTVAVAGAKVTVMLDLYNLTNANTVTNFFLTSGATYNTIIAALNPRTTQLAVRLAF